MSAAKTPITVFWSWQSDSDEATNKNFIGACLQAAAKGLKKAEGHVITVDRDTRGVGGSPSIAETILKKIRAADVFVFDATHVYRTPRPAPNPNVALELGYALAVLGENRVIGVMNRAGSSKGEEPPFDFRHRRWPIDYVLPPAPDSWGARLMGRIVAFARKDAPDRSAVEQRLTEALQGALSAALKEPKSGALRADRDLLIALRLWSALSSQELQDWKAYRLGVAVQYESMEQLKAFTEYLFLSDRPENHFEDDHLRSLHEEFCQALASYRHLCSVNMIPTPLDLDRLVVIEQSTSEKLDRELNEKVFFQQVETLAEAIRAVWAAWSAYAQEVSARYPEVTAIGVNVQASDSASSTKKTGA